MTEIRPFRGLRYDTSRVRPDDVIAPPYDVVGAEAKQALLGRSPYNVAHLELAPGDEATRFDRAAQALEAWRNEGVLRKEEQPAYYVYEQRFAVHGETVARRCFFARMRLHPPEDGVVRPHEATMSGPRAERLALLSATQTNTSPILAMFDDAQGRAGRVLQAVAETAPDFEATDAIGDRHRLWVVRDDAHVADLTVALEASNVTIADGHHRYATALEYLGRQQDTGAELSVDAPARYVLTGLVPEDDPGLIILPIHRLVRTDLPLDTILERLGALYEVSEVPGGLDAAEAAWERVQANALGLPTFAMLIDGRTYLATARAEGAVEAAMPAGMSAASKGIAAIQLTETVLGPALGIDQAALAAGAVTFTEEVAEARDAVERGDYRLAFLVNPTRVDQVSGVCDAGELMPQKTTFYYPKLATGMVLNPLED